MEVMNTNLTAQESVLGHRRIFTPPLSSQRYTWVRKYIESNPQITSVTDVGCGNGRLVVWLKSLANLTTINCLDKDFSLLDAELDNYFRPGLCEMLVGRQNTENPLNIRVYHGDISIPDDRLAADCFVMVEVIEHLDLEDVASAARAIFGYYQPKTVIVTTPNAEVNPALRAEGEPPAKFRHADHKFEWTRGEFRNWAENICRLYPEYEFAIDGVGLLPNFEHLGPATQIAVFHRDVLAIADSNPERPNRHLTCLDLMINKLNIQPTLYEFQVDSRQKKISLLAEFELPGFRIDQSSQPLDKDFDWTQ